ncbi:Uncharacterized membrane protein YphA, DoxX/SURF4 family [Actinacidiphila rubida]|uniref:Uncharacterized membrane protein YphA, DoxX/SURF4 family n=2 Tax=Actinacidiphila rubida TaxID=310780 RepID=A0A1H8JJH6_9ACTN|nr:Uncharacterized membrane protein YphA, DoxX/SURF4 family [Actinacidiphila rubida]
MLACVFVGSGVGALRAPAVPTGPAPEADPDPAARRLPYLPQNARELAQVCAAVQVGAGALLALGRLPRLSSLALAASLVPTTLTDHAFWTVEDPEERAVQRVLFLKNVSLTGGLLLAAADTHGKPSLAYRARGAAHRTGADVAGTAHAVVAGTGDLAHAVVSGTGHLAQAVRSGTEDIAHSAAAHLHDATGSVRGHLP